MKVIVVGMGKTGLTLIEMLTKEGIDVTVIDCSKRIIDSVTDKYNVSGVEGSGASRETLKKAGAETADMLIALTAVDEINLLSCLQAKNLGTRYTAARLVLSDLSLEKESLIKEYHIDYIVRPKIDVAEIIYNNIGLPGHVRLDSFFDGAIQMLSIVALKDSPFCGKSLLDLHKELNGSFLVVAVVRDGKLFIPDGSFVCEEGDNVYLTSDQEGVAETFKKMGIITTGSKKVLVVGGGFTGDYLAEKLLKKGKDVTIIEENIQNCKKLMEKYPKAKISYGNAESVEILDAEGIAKKDVVVSITDRDEANLVVSMYAWSEGVPSIITRIETVAHAKMLHKVNMDITVSPCEVAANKLYRYVRNSQMKDAENEILRFNTICDSLAELMEFDITENCSHLNIPFRDKAFKLKKDTLVAAIIRNGEMKIPGGSSTLQVGDKVFIVSASKNKIKNLNEIFH
ncbi:MAG: Trk system potassium transporter TrkA [Lachnospiraceae bacterium]|nr:Trk system potassium transporter TrkA [Lachnospiraceae bacterium]